MEKKVKPTESELEILQILWENEPATVRTINDKLNEKRDVGYTTTLKIMQLMLGKNLLSRQEHGRKHLYTSVYKENETQKVLLDKFLHSAFKGSAMKLVMQALGNHKTSKEELSQIKALIQKIEEKDGKK
jgi:predicted transcriptional regulator